MILGSDAMTLRLFGSTSFVIGCSNSENVVSWALIETVNEHDRTVESISWWWAWHNLPIRLIDQHLEPGTYGLIYPLPRLRHQQYRIIGVPYLNKDGNRSKMESVSRDISARGNSRVAGSGLSWGIQSRHKPSLLKIKGWPLLVWQ